MSFSDDVYTEISTLMVNIIYIFLLQPTFEVVSQSGPPHDPTFTMMTMIGNKRFPKASAKSKAEAKKMAAAHACNILHVSHGYQRVKGMV